MQLGPSDVLLFAWQSARAYAHFSCDSCDDALRFAVHRAARRMTPISNLAGIEGRLWAELTSSRLISGTVDLGPRLQPKSAFSRFSPFVGPICKVGFGSRPPSRRRNSDGLIKGGKRTNAGRRRKDRSLDENRHSSANANRLHRREGTLPKPLRAGQIVIRQSA